MNKNCFMTTGKNAQRTQKNKKGITLLYILLSCIKIFILISYINIWFAVSPLNALNKILAPEVNENNEVVFSVKAKGANVVMLAGNFNSWEPYKIYLEKKEDDIWSTVVKLPYGLCEYRYIIDGKWFPDRTEKFIVSKRGKVFKFPKFLNNDKLGYKIRYIGELSGCSSNNKIGYNESKNSMDLKLKIKLGNSIYGMGWLNINFPDSDYLKFFRSHIALKISSLKIIMFYNDRIRIPGNPSGILNNQYKNYTTFPEIKERDIYGQGIQGISASYNIFGVYLFALYSGYKGYNNNHIYLRLKKDFPYFKIAGTYFMDRYRDSTWPEQGGSSPSPYPPSVFNLDSMDWMSSPEGVFPVFVADKTYFDKQNVNYSFQGIDFRAGSQNASLFFEAGLNLKKGGWYGSTLKSDGTELPIDDPDYGKTNSKYVYFHNSSYKEPVIVTGGNLSSRHAGINLTYIFKKRYFDRINSKDISIKPLFQKVVINSFLRIKYVRLSLNSKFIFPKRIKNYDYNIMFDDNNFQYRILRGCYTKIVLNPELKLKFGGLVLSGALFYYKYKVGDIFFDTDDRWNITTTEFRGNIIYSISKRLDFIYFIRHKIYNYREKITETRFRSYSNAFRNIYFEFLYKIRKSINLSFRYGITPTLDEDREEGFEFSLKERLDRNFPFFKNAEESLEESVIFSIRLEISY